jgi:hypothetical protein
MRLLLQILGAVCLAVSFAGLASSRHSTVVSVVLSIAAFVLFQAAVVLR